VLLSLLERVADAIERISQNEPGGDAAETGCSL